MARIAVDMQELVNKVTVVSKVVPSKVIKPILGCVLFDLTEDGVFLLAFDLETGVKAKLNCEYEGFGRFAVDGKVFYEVVKTLPTDVGASLEVTPASLSIECGKSKFKLSVVDPSDFPEVSLSESSVSFEIDANVLHKMIEKVIFCAATDEFMRNLNGVYWELGNGFLRLVASDGFRLALAEERLEIQDEMGFLLSLKSMKELMSVAESCGEKDSGSSTMASASESSRRTWKHWSGSSKWNFQITRGSFPRRSKPRSWRRRTPSSKL